MRCCWWTSRSSTPDAKKDTTKQAALWAAFWIGLGVIFGVIVYIWNGPQAAGEYAAGFLIEKALSVDNIFVFLVIFSYFQVKPEYQHHVLFYGILGAIIFRGLFIAAGVTLINRFEWVLYLLGVLLRLHRLPDRQRAPSRSTRRRTRS